MNAKILDENFKLAGEILIPAQFGEIKEHNLYLYVKYYLANLRNNSAHVKTRGLVRGGGKKPWSQKGGGRGRAGSLTSPLFVGGGVSHGPSNAKNYDIKINKKQKKLALYFALAQKAAQEKLYVVENISIQSGKTKDADAFFTKFSERNALFVALNPEDATFLAFRNLKNCYLIYTHEINAYLVSTFRSLVMERAALEQILKDADLHAVEAQNG